jgi:hypothetical protein
MHGGSIPAPISGCETVSKTAFFRAVSGCEFSPGAAFKFIDESIY